MKPPALLPTRAAERELDASGCFRPVYWPAARRAWRQLSGCTSKPEGCSPDRRSSKPPSMDDINGSVGYFRMYAPDP